MGEKALLIAENDPEAREVFLENNPKNGFWIQWVNRGEEALRWLDQRPFDMVITEVELEDLSGLQLLGQVKQRFPETPVIVMTAQGSIPQAIEAIKQGALDYVVKPLSGVWLEERMGQVDHQADRVVWRIREPLRERPGVPPDHHPEPENAGSLGIMPQGSRQ